MIIWSLYLVIGFEELLEHLDIANSDDDGHVHGVFSSPKRKKRRATALDALVHIQQLVESGEPELSDDDDHDHGHGLTKPAETVSRL